MLTSTITTRLATLEDLDVVLYIATRNKKTIGFIGRVVLTEAISYKRVYVAEDIADDCVIGFANIWRRKRDDWITIMEICVDAEYRRQGAGRALLAEIRHDNFDRPLSLKCPVDNDSNGFYRALGWRLANVIPPIGKKRALNRWIIQ